MPWLQLFVNTDNQQAPVIEDTLLNAGALSVTFKEHIPQGENEKPILEPGLNETPLWDNTRVVGLFDSTINNESVNWLLDQLFDGNLTYRWEQLEDKDWEREWMQNYRPIQCSDNLWICPSWVTPPNPEAINVLMDPGLAFGTGTHPTTFLCMQWLAQQSLDNSNIIDYGCGSGILGVTALLLGAKQATGIDIDPQALLATHGNLARNRLTTERFTVHLPEQCPKIQADIVIANILAGPLVELADTLIELLAPGGKLCLSGILQEQADTIMSAYSHAIDFDAFTQSGEGSGEKDGWIRLSGNKL